MRTVTLFGLVLIANAIDLDIFKEIVDLGKIVCILMTFSVGMDIIDFVNNLWHLYTTRHQIVGHNKK